MPLAGYTILAVDDYEPHNYALSRILQNAHGNVLSAFTGSQALKLASEHPNLIIMDVNLPDMNGFEVCRRLKMDPDTATIPVIFLSATYTDSAARLNADRVGGSAFLFQPVEPAQLVAVIRGEIARSEDGQV